ncbi:MAG: choice-of-anchor Q domain-containing protein [Solirubrobacteraceae bacterium]
MLLLAATVLALSLATGARAATFTVNTTADNAPVAAECAGAAADCGLRQAVDKANQTPGDDTVSLPAGHYTLTIAGSGEDLDQTGDLDVAGPDAIAIAGAGARTTTIDAGATDRVLQVLDGATAAISDVTITGGSVDGDGGGIENSGALTVTRSTVRGNTASGEYAGGGIHTGGGGPILLAVSAQPRAAATGPALTVSESTISANSSGEYGGGLDLDSGPATITNTTITANHSVDDGAGVDIDTGSPVQFTNTTIARNASDGSPGGVWADGSSNVRFQNTIVAENAASGGTRDCDTTFSASSSNPGNNLDSDATCFAGSADLSDVTPKLGALANNGGPTDTLALLAGSPAIDAGASIGGVSGDQRGVARPQASAFDIGAYEFAPPAAVTGGSSAVTPSSATIAGTATPNGAGTYHFEYGTSTAYGSSTAGQAISGGSSGQPVSAGLTGLHPNTTYHYRLVVTNTDGTATGADAVFTTPAAAVAPAVATGPATAVKVTTATLNGTVNPDGLAVTYHFEYGTTTGYGSSTPDRPLAAGTATVPVSATITGLRPGTTYHVRMVGVSSAGTSRGADVTFRTPAAGVADVSVRGLPGGGRCTRSTRLRLRLHLTSGTRITSVRVTFGGRTLSTSRSRNQTITIDAARLPRGRHVLRVVVRNGARVAAVRNISVRACGRRAPAPTPHFTG